MVDYNGHVNNIVFVQWMQRVAIDHATLNGCDKALYESLGVSWVARFHHIDYLQSAFQGETVVAVTWIAEARKVACRRRYRFCRNSIAGETLANAETEWVFVDQESGRPVKIADPVMDCFDVLGTDFPISA